jgi:hypothetical protein
MSNLGALNRQAATHSQARALTILCKCLASANLKSSYVQNRDNDDDMNPSGIVNPEARSSREKRKQGDPQSKNIRLARSHHPVFHMYILTWL